MSSGENFMGSNSGQVAVHFSDNDINSSGVACYSFYKDFISTIGEGVLKDPAHEIASNKISNEFLNQLRNFTKQYSSSGGGLQPMLLGFLPHLLMMLLLIVTVSRVLHFLLRRLKQPLIVCQMMAGFVIFLPWKKDKHDDEYNLFTWPSNRRLEEVMALSGLLLYLFLAGLKMDVSMVWRSGKKPAIIGLAGLFIPLLLCSFAYAFLHNFLNPFVKKEGKFMFFIVALLCTSCFPVLADILSELELLNSEVGRLALSSSMIQNLLGWVFKAIFIALNQSQTGVKTGIMSVTLFVLLIFFNVFIVRPYGLWVVQNTPSNGSVRDVHIFVIIAAVIVTTVACDFGGITYLFGPCMMGLALPYGPPLGTALIERIELVASEVLFPLLFIIEGENMDLIAAAGQELRLWYWVELIVIVVSVAKVVTVAAVAAYCDVPLKHGLLLGLILNFRGFVEMYTLIYFKQGQVIDSATYTMIMLSIIMVTTICVPLVSTLYKPLLYVENHASGQTVQQMWSHAELRLITCFFDDKPIPTLLDFLECASSSKAQNHTTVYALHLKKLEACAVSSFICHCNEKGHIKSDEMDHVHNHFIAFGQVKKESVTVLPLTSIAPEKTMYQDVCSLILKKNTALVIVPFTRKNSLADVETPRGMSGANFLPVVLAQARCSVGIMVYHGITRMTSASHPHWKYFVGVVFMGGPDDREAVAIATRMAYHPCVYLKFFCFRRTPSCRDSAIEGSYEKNDMEQTLDDQVICDLQRGSDHDDRRLAVSECIMSENDVEQTMSTIHSLGNKYDLLIVGRRRGPSSSMINAAEFEEQGFHMFQLGMIGDVLASSNYTKPANVLVVQQYIQP